MKWRLILVATSLALASASAAANDTRIDDFYGNWQGVELQVTGADGVMAPTAKDLNVELRRADAGFEMSWIAFEREAGGVLKRHKFEASFTPTDRPGVFAFNPGKPSLLSRLFADPATGNPLKGETLLWARLEGGTLTVYSLAIDHHGGFDLDRYARTLTDGGMTVRYTHRIENDLMLTIEGRLEKAGG